MEKKIQYIKDNGYFTHLNRILFYSAQMLKDFFFPFLVAMILVSVFIFYIYINAIFYFFPDLEMLSQELLKLDIGQLPRIQIFQYFALNALSNAVLSIVNIVVCSLIFQRFFCERTVVFKAFTNVFTFVGVQVVLYSFLLHFLISCISYYLQFTPLASVSIIIILMMHTLTMLVIPIMISEKVHLHKAIKYSIDIVNIKPFTMLGYLMLSFVLSISGVLFFGVGLVFTYPFFYIFLMALYVQIRQQMLSSI